MSARSTVSAIPVVPSRGALFGAFAQMGLSGFGGVLPWARRVLVEERGWLDDREFAELLSLAQILPGPNVVNVSIAYGARCHGPIGSLIAIFGLMFPPFLIVLGIGALFLHYGDIPLVQGAVQGIVPAAAGMVVATGLKLAHVYRRDASALIVAAIAFVALAVLHWPLVLVVLGLGSLSVAYVWLRGRRL